MNNFRVPSEPCPLPSLGSGSDEESFVVLGNYPADLEDTPSVETASTMAGMVAVVEEAKRLIVEEMAVVKTEANPDKLDNDEKIGPSDTRGDNQMERSVRLPDMPHMESGSESIGAISIANFTTDLTSEEVQNKISQIIDENIHLKDTIMQNTKTMNAQHERILAWYKESQKVHEDHKAKIYEAKAVIERLKKENEFKSAELKSTQELLDVRDEELKNLKSKITTMETKLDEKLTQSSNDNLKKENKFKSEELKSTKELLDARDEELKNLKSKITIMERKLDEKLTRTSNDNLKEFELDVAQKKMRELESEMAIMNLENFKLREESNKLNDEMEKAAVYEKHVKELQKLLDVSNNKIEELQTELSNVQKTISENQEGYSAEVTSLRQQLVTLMQYQTNLPCPEDLDNAKKQLANIQVQLLQTEQSRAEAYNQIAILNSQIEGLARQQRDLVEQNEALRGRGGNDDEIYALKTQLDVYKTDFEAERTAKNALREEKEKLVDDLQNLQRRNQQLQEEIEITREHGDFVTFPSSTRSTPFNNTTRSTPNDRSFQCPQCSFGFNNLQALQNHVYRCIELNETIP